MRLLVEEIGTLSLSLSRASGPTATAKDQDASRLESRLPERHEPILVTVPSWELREAAGSFQGFVRRAIQTRSFWETAFESISILILRGSSWTGSLRQRQRQI